MTAVYPDLTEQRALVEDFMRPAETLLPVARLQHGSDGDVALWQQMAALGWLGVSLAENAGGIGLGPVEEVLAGISLGRQLPPPGFVASIIAAHAFARTGYAAEARAIVAGEMRVAFALSDNAAVEATEATWLVAIGDNAITLSRLGEREILDDAHWNRAIDRIAGREPSIRCDSADIVALARLLIAAHLAGIAAAAGERAVDYSKVREQFGQPIGAFQAIKHRCADMAIAAHGARELTVYAAIALAESRGDAAILADAALNFAARAARENAGGNIQVHGGMGFSAECDAHQFLKAAHLLDAASGGSSRGRTRLMRSD